MHHHENAAVRLDAVLAAYFTNTAPITRETTPFLAAPLELQPWLDQWHNESDMLYIGSPTACFDGYRQTQQGERGLTDDLYTWRPLAAPPPQAKMR